jgi:hypothetical protein
MENENTLETRKSFSSSGLYEVMKTKERVVHVGIQRTRQMF